MKQDDMSFVANCLKCRKRIYRICSAILHNTAERQLTHRRLVSHVGKKYYSDDK